MDYTLILRPLIGGVIGLVTNYIAIKMLFRPLKEVRIGKLKLPFTPGIIPHNKSRIAKSVGDAVANYLLDEETLNSYLLSEDALNVVKEKVVDSLNSLEYNSDTLKEVLLKYMSEERYDATGKVIQENLTDKVYEKVKDAELGKIVSEQITKAAEEKFKGSMLGHLGGNALSEVIAHSAEEKVNEYIEENGREYISNMVEEEMSSLSSNSVSSLATYIAESKIDLVSIVMNTYKRIVEEKLASILRNLNISKIITQKIDEMDVLELEKIILEIMHKELNALVYLGGLIGLILGLVNLLF